jgi:hypothetical protein
LEVTVDPETIKVIANLGSAAVMALLFAWLLTKEMPTQRKEASDHVARILAEERKARTEDREAMVKALNSNTASNNLLSGQISNVCKHPVACSRP